ncbi:upstream activation factor subunit spp27-like [Hibiscus syriacus]|uniref:upstream activation factor subunit spp27-like n=1 Tax=Hibiscus syriacus TaxID=106335 RepID=UPI001923E91A|nr:upstream activation factor subunit spp27-like [Hibiscus syriacus]
MLRVYKGFRALLDSPAAAPPSSAATAVKFSSSAANQLLQKWLRKSRKSQPLQNPRLKNPPAAPTGILKAYVISPHLRQFLGTHKASRADAVKQIWSYAKSKNLQNPDNKREIFFDEKLKTIFDGKENISFLEIGKILNPHFSRNLYSRIQPSVAR